MLLLDTAEVPKQLRQYLRLWFELMFNSPAIVDGHLLSAEEVSKPRTRDLLISSVGTGMCERFVQLKVRAEVGKYASLATWSKIYLHGIKFEGPSVVSSARKLAKSASSMKQDGEAVSSMLSNHFTTDPGRSNSVHMSGITVIPRLQRSLCQHSFVGEVPRPHCGHG